MDVTDRLVVLESRSLLEHEQNPVPLNVFEYLFSSIAEQVCTALGSAVLSPSIKERSDLSCVIGDRIGELIAQATRIPAHLGIAPLSVLETAFAELFDSCGWRR